MFTSPYLWVTAITILLHTSLWFALHTRTYPAHITPAQIPFMQLALAHAPTTPNIPTQSVEKPTNSPQHRVQPIKKTTPARPTAQPQHTSELATTTSPTSEINAQPETVPVNTPPSTVNANKAPENNPAPPKETPPSFAAAYLANPAPAYPSAAAELGESGTTLLRVHVDRDGLPEDVHIAHSSGSIRLDRAALNAVKRWRFIPAKRGQETINGIVLVPIHFELKTITQG